MKKTTASEQVTSRPPQSQTNSQISANNIGANDESKNQDQVEYTLSPNSVIAREIQEVASIIWSDDDEEVEEKIKDLPSSPKDDQESATTTTTFNISLLPPPTAYAAEETPLFFVKTTKNAYTPIKSSDTMGYELRSAAQVTIDSNKQRKVPTDLLIKIPNSTLGRITPVPGLDLNKKLAIVDCEFYPTYKGAVYVHLSNVSREPYVVKKGELLGQIILQKLAFPEAVELSRLPVD